MFGVLNTVGKFDYALWAIFALNVMVVFYVVADVIKSKSKNPDK